MARVFLKLGLIGFGGPAAHIALMEDEIVRRRRWLTREAFLDYLAAAQLVPGPNSTELAIHIGRERAGWPGLLVAGACFVFPAALIVGTLAVAYERHGTLPAVRGVFLGVAPVIIAIVLGAVASLARSAVRSWTLALIGAGALVAVVTGGDEIVVLLLAGASAAVLRARADRPRDSTGEKSALLFAAQSAAATGGAAVATAGAGTIFGVFLKIGSVLFGSGYVLLALLRADVVERFGWLTETQLLDAIAVGQMTPGPVFTTATFVGYLAGGYLGAVAATIGIFLPAFVFVAVSGPLVPRLRRSPVAGAVLDGVSVASIALMAYVAWQLGRVAVHDFLTAGVAIVSLVLLLRFRVNPSWLVLAGALLGWAWSAMRMV